MTLNVRYPVPRRLRATMGSESVGARIELDYRLDRPNDDVGLE
jgi:hypothetical protein